jgi:hypothetical protein
MTEGERPSEENSRPQEENRPRKLFPTSPPRLEPTSEPPPPTRQEEERAYNEGLFRTIFRRTWRELADLGNLRERFRQFRRDQ